MQARSSQVSHGRGIDDRAQAQLSMLVVMFLLGIAVNLIGVPSETSGTAKVASTIFLILHGLLGLGLIINAGWIYRLASKSYPSLIKKAQVGAAVIVLTFIAGLLTNATNNNWWSFAMAAGFAASLPIYGLLLLHARIAQLKH